MGKFARPRQSITEGVAAMLVVAFVVVWLTACSFGSKPAPILLPTPTAGVEARQPNFTALQVKGLVYTCLKVAGLGAGWFEAEFNVSNRQWIVTTWATEEDSKKYLGRGVYLVDDATGKVLNCPPAWRRF